MLEINDNTVLKLSDSFSLYCADLKEKKFWIFDIKKGQSFKLNETSYYFLSQVDGANSLKHIIESLIQRYNENTETIKKDINELISFCMQKKIFREEVKENE